MIDRAARIVRGSSTGALLALVLAAGCSRGGGEPDADVAEVVLSLVQAPTDVACVAISISIGGEALPVKRFGVNAGQSTSFVLPRLPVGLAVFSLEAFNVACAQVNAGT